jgi:hypothetical protein
MLERFDKFYLHRQIFVMSISVILPIGGTCPYFLHTNLANISETCGFDFSEFDMVLLTKKTISPELQQAIDVASQKYKFRVVKCPFESELHLDLIDWAMPNVDLNDWVFIQHMDTFWRIGCNPWLKDTLDIIKKYPNNVAVAECDDWKDYYLMDKRMYALHDYAVAYNRKLFVEHNLTLNWGELSKIRMSDKLKSMIKNRLVFSSVRGEIKFTDCVDGSDVITMEIAVHFNGKVSRYGYNRNLIHPFGMIRPILTMQRQKDCLKINYTRHQFIKNCWKIFSLVSSCHFDLEQNRRHIIPWKLVSSKLNLDIETIKNEELFKIMSRYENPKNVLGIDDDDGIKNIFFEQSNDFLEEFKNNVKLF